MFAVYNGPKGIRKMAERTHRMAEIFAAAVKGFGYEVVTKSFFDTVTIHAPGRAHALWAKAKEQRINLRFVDADHLGATLADQRLADRTYHRVQAGAVAAAGEDADAHVGSFRAWATAPTAAEVASVRPPAQARRRPSR